MKYNTPKIIASDVATLALTLAVQRDPAGAGQGEQAERIGDLAMGLLKNLSWVLAGQSLLPAHVLLPNI